VAGNAYWVLVVNVGWGTPAGGSAAQYFVGDFDGTIFRNANSKDVALWTNYGPDSYAEQTWSDVPASDGRRISMGWMSSTRYCTVEPTFPWRGALTLPRELSLVETKSGVRLAQSPVRELSTLRGATLAQSDFAAAGQTLEIDATLDRDSSADFTVCADEKTATHIGYDGQKHEVYVDRSKSRPGAPFHKDFPARYAAPVVSRKDGDLPIRIFVDRTAVEVFADDGLSVLSVNTFPDPAAVRFDPPASGVKSLRVWRLNSIWKAKD
jgi:fructan beta-fructosidase